MNLFGKQKETGRLDLKFLKWITPLNSKSETVALPSTILVSSTTQRNTRELFIPQKGNREIIC